MAKNSHDKLFKLSTFCIFLSLSTFSMEIQLNIFTPKLILPLHLNAIYYSSILVFALVCTLNFSKVTIATLTNLGLAVFLRGEKGESKH